MREKLDHAVLTIRKSAPPYRQGNHGSTGKSAPAGSQQCYLRGHARRQGHAHPFFNKRHRPLVHVNHGIGERLHVIVVAQLEGAVVVIVFQVFNAQPFQFFRRIDFFA